ncbi:helix-turn-helix domain-containing protein [Streptomyces uncialis]|uniref:helix-turn-helix domain-containing protein n=1 Tax=Streptomyces uncialis TaxID=1048205 RepID=UPI0038150D61
MGIDLAFWRLQRGLAKADLAEHTDVSTESISRWETGQDWVDRRGVLAVLANALRVDPTELTGQPYSPTGEQHAVVRAVAFHLRRHLAEPPRSSTRTTESADDLAARVRTAVAAEEAGDEHALALALPELVRAADRVVPLLLAPASDERAQELRVHAHVLAAGLLRRLGYRDLGWTFLHRARPGAPATLPVLLEEVRLLIDLGSPEYALARAARAEHAAGDDAELSALTAFAHAMAGRREQAEQLLAAAVRRARNERDAAVLAVARAAAAVEYGAPAKATEYARAAARTALRPVERAQVQLISAGAAARGGDTARAVADLVEAEAIAPLRVRLDPFARELVFALASRADTPAVADAVRPIAERAGLVPPSRRTRRTT